MTASNPTASKRRLAWLAVAVVTVLACLPLATAIAQVPTGPPTAPPSGIPTAPPSGPPTVSPSPTPDTGTTKRLSGESRYDTAEKIAADAFPQGAENAIVVRGDNFPDALAGSYLAGVKAGPIIPVGRDEVPPGSERALARITKKAFVLGGTAAVSEAVVATLKADGLDVERISGESRYDTARKVALAGGMPAARYKDMNAPQPPPGAPGSNPITVGTAFLATGDSFADALAAGPLAYFGKHPVILTRSDILSAEAKAALQDEALAVEQVVIVGGRKAVSTAVEEEVKALGIKVYRVSGEDRNQTATALASFYLGNQSTAPNAARMTYSEINLALGQNFPDALALGARGGKTGTVIVLAQTPQQLGDATRGFIGTQCAAAGQIVVAGGESVISKDTETAAGQAALCGTASAFTATPANYVRITKETHEVIVTVKDASGKGVPNALIRYDVYRSDRPDFGQEQLDPVDPYAETKYGKTGADGTLKITYSYTGPTVPDPRGAPQEVLDRIVVCQHAGPEGSPETCLAAKRRNANTLVTEAKTIWHQTGFRATLAGTDVTPGPGDENAAGSSAVTFKMEAPSEGQPAVEKLCWMVDVHNLDDKPTSAGLYKKGTGDAPATLAVTFTPVPNADGYGAACTSAANFTKGQSMSSWIRDIKANPGNYVVQVNTAAFPEGAVRGELKAGTGATPTPTASGTATASPTATATSTSTATASPTATATATSTSTATASPTATSTATSSPTATASP